LRSLTAPCDALIEFRKTNFILKGVSLDARSVPSPLARRPTASKRNDVAWTAQSARRSRLFEGIETEMKLALYRIVLLFIAGLVCGGAILTAGGASAQQEAIAGVVSGESIQKVGFRAMIQKQAIMYNLAGYARNVPDGTVSIALQGDKDRIEMALEAIRVGSKRSSRDNIIKAAAASLDPNLKTFTVFHLTSTRRNITNPYDLVFHLRPANHTISKKEAAAAWNTIAESTLKGDDLAKFMKHLDSDD
jgi:acylphosphatase